MNKETQTSLASRNINNKLVSSLNPFLKNDDNNHNENWMKDWMEQADNYRNNNEVLKLIGNDVDGFLNYADSIEGKYV
jgi:hypothetical protein